MTTTRQWLCLGMILAYSLTLRIALLDRPFNRDPEGVSAYYGILARNYIRRPISQTHLVPVQNLGRTNPAKYYGHHPPLVPLLIAGTYAAFGFRADSPDLPPDWQTRFSTMLFTLACIGAIFQMVRKRSGPRAALIATGAFATLPITVYYGGFPDVVGTQLIFLILLTAGVYERFWETPNARSLAGMTLAFAFAALTDWVAFFLPIALGVHFLATRPLRQWKWIVGFAVICAAIFAAIYAHIAVVEHDWLWMGDELSRRTGSVSDARVTFTPLDWLRVAAARATHLFTAPLVLCLLLAPAIRARLRLFAILLAWAVIHILIGRQGVYQHEWWWWPLAPPVAIAAGLVTDRLAPHSRVANASIIAMLIALATWSTTTSWRALHFRPEMSADPNSHRITDIGLAIRESAPPDSAVMLTEKDDTIGLWYYADRPIICDIWTIEDFKKRLQDPQWTDLPFGFTEVWSDPPRAFICPRIYERFATELLEYLQAHYTSCDLPGDLHGKFFVFDLTRPR